MESVDWSRVILQLGPIQSVVEELSKVMNADRVEVSWDEQSSKWLIRIKVGEEVLRRFSEQPQDVDHITLQTEAVDLAADEGYTVDRSQVTIL